MGIEQDQAETKIVRQTALENLLLRAQTSQEKQRKQKELEQQKQHEKDQRLRLIRRITSVYFFIRHELGLGHEAITAEEFEAAEEKLDELAPRNARRWSIRNPLAALLTVITRDDTMSAWHSYKNQGYFPYHTRPFISMTNTFGAYAPESFELDYLSGEKSYRNTEIAMMRAMTVPPNIIELFDKIWEKRYPLMRIDAQLVP